MSRIQKSIAKWVGALLLSFCSFSYSNAQVPVINPGSAITPPTGPVVNRPMGDDGYASVPLPFGFPFFGRTFTNSFMFDNGVVGFFDPTTNSGCNPQNGWCGGNSWNSQQFNTNMPSQFSYMIAPYWTDVRPVAGTTYTTQGDSSQMTYSWNNIGEYYNPGRLSSFSLQIKPSGFIGVDYSKVDLVSSSLSIGVVGDPSKGQFVQHFWRGAGNQINLNSFQPWNITSTGEDLCTSNPLSSQTCPGYAAAYMAQQCSISALYNTQCPGYQQAFFSQQCSLNSLYNVNCPGYAQAYFNQQCSLNSLYNENCPGYAQAYYNYQCSVNPLYHTGCDGYQQAYFNQQCSLNSLYNTACPGYAQAYFNQQCTINQLYNTQCPGYAAAYFSQQCSLNGLYDKQCPNYAEAYATKQALEKSSSPPPAPVIATTTTSEPAKIAVVADPVVNSVVTSTATSTSPAQAATATVPLVQSNSTTSSTSVTTAAVVKEQKQEKKEDASSTSVSSTTTTQNTSSDEKKSDQPKTNRQELQERRVAAARAQAVEAGKNLAENIGKSVSMEQQVAVQNVVIAAMGYTPGFDAYNKAIIPDGVGYRPFTIYNNQRNVDNPAGRRFMTGSDRLHNELIQLQYNK